MTWGDCRREVMPLTAALARFGIRFGIFWNVVRAAAFAPYAGGGHHGLRGRRRRRVVGLGLGGTAKPVTGLAACRGAVARLFRRAAHHVRRSAGAGGHALRPLDLAGVV